MLLAIQLRFTVFLVTFCVAHAEVLAHRQAHIPENPLTDHGSGGIHPRCSWNCTVIGTDLPEETKNVIFKNRLVSFVVQYELKVVDECVNKTLRLNSSGNTNLTEVCQVQLLANNEFPSFANRMECFLNRFHFIAECIEIRATCTLKPERTTVTKSPSYYSSPFSLRFARGHLANLGITFDSVKCKSKATDTLHSCVNISITGNNTQSDKHSAWSKYVFFSLCTVFVIVFIQYSLVFLCLFSPTVATENGRREIVLGGASPVSLRGLMGNYFFSDNETIWHKARTLILLLLVLPFPFLAPAIFIDYLQHRNAFPPFQFFTFSGSGIEIHLFQPFMTVCYSCYFIQAFYVSFYNVTEKAKPCLVCQRIKPNLICNDGLPGRILNHLRIQPLILVKSWRAFVQFLVSYFKMSLIVLPSRSCNVSCVFFLRYVLFIISLAMIPVVTVILFLAGVVVVLIGIYLTSPVVRLCSATKSRETNGFPILLLVLRIFVTAPAILGAWFILFSAAFGYFITLILAVEILFCEECLPFLACLVLVCYYLWSSYSSFTDQYQDLAVTLFKKYKKSRHHHFLDGALATEQDIDSSNSKKSKDKGNMVRIPKELFDMACEELMPIREGVCKLVLKVTSILCFVFLVFSMIMLSDVGATPVTKALLTFFTGSFPKIAAIYFDESRQKKLDALITEEEVPKILDDYMNGTPKSYNQGQDNCETNANEVPIFAHESEENIEMVNM